MKRSDQEKVYNQAYEFLSYEEKCMYCGVPSECIDHVPPISWVNSLGTHYFREKNIHLYFIYACLECNSKLHDKSLFTIVDRKVYLVDAYNKKYKKLLKLPSWSNEDIKELSPNLQRGLKQKMRKKRFIEEKLKFLSSYLEE